MANKKNTGGSNATPAFVGPAGMVKIGSRGPGAGKLNGADAGPGDAGRKTYFLGGKGMRVVDPGTRVGPGKVK